MFKRNFKKKDWRLWHHFYASLSFLSSLTIFHGREMKIKRYTFLYFNYVFSLKSVSNLIPIFI